MFFVGPAVGSAGDDCLLGRGVGFAGFVGKPVSTSVGLGVDVPASSDGRKDMVGVVAVGDSVGRAGSMGDSDGVKELGNTVGVTLLTDGISVGKVEMVGRRM